MRDAAAVAGNLFVVAAPSGAGKTSLVRAMLEREPNVRLSVSYTTRPPRPGERDGIEYHFVDVERFEALRDGGHFLESALVHGNHYATPLTWLREQTAAGSDVLLEIDWQGAAQVRRAIPQAVGVFILPPSVATLEERLKNRGLDSAEQIARRLAAAKSEMQHVGEFDYVIINQDFAAAVADLCAIVRACRLRLAAQHARHRTLFDQLLG
jgi:guanylate kinase